MTFRRRRRRFNRRSVVLFNLIDSTGPPPYLPNREVTVGGHVVGTLQGIKPHKDERLRARISPSAYLFTPNSQDGYQAVYPTVEDARDAIAVMFR